MKLERANRTYANCIKHAELTSQWIDPRLALFCFDGLNIERGGR